jgi:hypothetical protein
MYLAQKEARILAPRPTTGDDDLTKVKQPYEDEHGYVYLQHGDVYRICFRNHSDKNNDVIIEVDGKEIGCWRLKAYQTATIEHPVDDSISRADLGLVKVTFIPEKPKHHRIPAIDTFPLGAKGIGATKGGDWSESFSSGSHGGGQSVNLNTRSAGGTGLSGKSEQQFGTAGAIDRDYDRQTVINLRLVAKPSNEPRPLRSVNLTVSNPVPPPAN